MRLSPHIQHATLADLAALKNLADANRSMLGFVLRPALQEGIEKHFVLMAQDCFSEKLIGFASYWHRRDTRTTIHALCVHVSSRLQGVGRSLLDALVQEARARGQTMLCLKAVQDTAANDFYQHYGFHLSGEEPGKQRAFCLWHLPLRRERESS